MFFKLYRDIYGFHVKASLLSINTEILLFSASNRAKTIGVKNVCQDSRRVIFLDYDDHLLEFLEDEIKYLQERFYLSDFYIFKSGSKHNGFHAICIDKVSFKENMRIVDETSCDSHYKAMSIRGDHHTCVLRILKKGATPAPTLIKKIKSDYSVRKKSRAHYNFLRLHYGIKDKPRNLDKSKRLYIIGYEAVKGVKPEELKEVR